MVVLENHAPYHPPRGHLPVRAYCRLELGSDAAPTDPVTVLGVYMVDLRELHGSLVVVGSMYERGMSYVT